MDLPNFVQKKTNKYIRVSYFVRKCILCDELKRKYFFIKQKNCIFTTTHFLNYKMIRSLTFMIMNWRMKTIELYNWGMYQ